MDHPNYQNDERISSEQIREKLRKQLEYYFSRENLMNDMYLQSQMDTENYVPISLIANFQRIKRLTNDLQFILDVLKESPLVEVDIEEKKVRSSDTKTSRKRCIIILRNVPFDATETEIFALFINQSCPVSAIGCERVLESDHLDCWYVTFMSEDDAQNAFLYITRENISIRGQKILARMKACHSISSIPYSQPVLNNHPIENLPRQSSTVSFPTHMNFYQQTMNRNYPVYPVQFWYLPSPVTDLYSPMIVPLNSIIRTYNGTNRSRITKPRNSTKTISNHNELSQSNPSHSAILPNETPDTPLPSSQTYSAE